MTTLLDMTVSQLVNEYSRLQRLTMDIIPITAAEFNKAAEAELKEMGLEVQPLSWVLAARNLSRQAGPKAFQAMEGLENQNWGCEE